MTLNPKTLNKILSEASPADNQGRNEAFVELRFELSDPIEGFKSLEGIDELLKDPQLKKDYDILDKRLDDLAIKMFNRQGTDELKKEKDLIDSIIDNIRDFQRDLFYVTIDSGHPGLFKLNSIANQLIRQSGEQKSNYPYKFMDVRDELLKLNAYRQFTQNLNYQDKKDFIILIDQGMSPGNAVRYAKMGSPISRKKEIPTKEKPGNYPGDEAYTYYVDSNQWYAYNIKTQNITNLSEDSKYAQTIEKLNKHFGTNIQAAKKEDIPSSIDPLQFTGEKMSPSAFFSKIAPAVIAVAKGGKIFPSVTMAQAALESGYGRKTIGTAKNMFGMKAKGSPNEFWSGESITVETQELIKGVKKTVRRAFRVYDSFEDSIRDHNRNLMTSEWYKNVRNATNPMDQIVALKSTGFKYTDKKTGEEKEIGYASASEYVPTLQNIVKKNNLEQYDKEFIEANSDKISSGEGKSSNQVTTKPGAGNHPAYSLPKKGTKGKYSPGIKAYVDAIPHTAEGRIASLDKIEGVPLKNFMNDLINAGYNITVNYCYRSVSEQKKISSSDKASAGHSPHNYGLAIDINISWLDDQGRSHFLKKYASSYNNNDGKQYGKVTQAEYKKIWEYHTGQLADKHKLRKGYEFNDNVHFDVYPNLAEKYNINLDNKNNIYTNLTNKLVAITKLLEKEDTAMDNYFSNLWPEVQKTEDNNNDEGITMKENSIISEKNLRRIIKKILTEKVDDGGYENRLTAKQYQEKNRKENAIDFDARAQSVLKQYDSDIKKSKLLGIDVYHRPGVRINDMDEKTQQMLAALTLRAKLDGITPPVITDGPRTSEEQADIMWVHWWKYETNDGAIKPFNTTGKGRKHLVALYANDNYANAIADIYEKEYYNKISMPSLKRDSSLRSDKEIDQAQRKAFANRDQGAIKQKCVAQASKYLDTNKISNHQYSSAFDIRTRDGLQGDVEKIIFHEDFKGLIKVNDETKSKAGPHYHISVKKAPKQYYLNMLKKSTSAIAKK